MQEPEIVFFTLPPYAATSPNPAFSILKSSLVQENVSVLIKYLNLELYEFDGFLEDLNTVLAPYVYLLNKHFDTNSNIDRVKHKYFTSFSEKYLCDRSLTNELWEDLLSNINRVFDQTVSSIGSSNIRFFGFSQKFDQWIPAVLLASKLKERYPKVPILIGGFGDKDKAILFLEKFNMFDYSTWGEGEDVLMKFNNELCKNTEMDLQSVPRLCYRLSNTIRITSVVSSFISLNNDILPNFDDFFELDYCLPEKNKLRIPIEGSRGCHWCKCKFCYLNQGYKYRETSVEDLINSIDSLTTKYNCNNVSFVDNDLIGVSIEKFDKLLDELIKLRKKKNNNLAIKVAEIIPFRKNSEIVKKMALAGFENIQIGYEAVNDTLLANMNKKQSFAMNIFLIKFCKKYGIQVLGANIITDTIGERSNDIIQSIQNLHFLRFIFSDNFIEQNITNLSVTEKAKFFKLIPQEELHYWNQSWLYDNMPEIIKNEENRFMLFDFQKQFGNYLWGLFEETSKHYYENQFTYNLFENGKNIEYREYFNYKEIKSLTFDEDYYWEILKLVNNQVLSFDELYIELSNSFSQQINKNLIKQQIDEMKNEHILYSSSDYDSIISIIDTQTLLK